MGVYDCVTGPRCFSSPNVTSTTAASCLPDFGLGFAAQCDSGLLADADIDTVKMQLAELKLHFSQHGLVQGKQDLC